jgi:23S rRNA pseudouridine2605 synthase
MLWRIHWNRVVKKPKKTMTRINKFLASCGVASRRKAEELILEGRVTVNDRVVDQLSFQVGEGKDIVKVDGEKISIKKHLYILLNKPKGVVSTTSDEKKRKTVVDIINGKKTIYPVGRLDYNTTGVLILTNDGDFSSLLTHPGNMVPREYEVRLDKPLENADRERLLNGILLDNRQSTFIRLTYPEKTNRKYVLAVSVEGRNHFVKRMFGALGYNVLSLNRKSFAGINADIPQGSFRELSQEEIKKVFKKYAP